MDLKKIFLALLIFTICFSAYSYVKLTPEGNILDTPAENMTYYYVHRRPSKTIAPGQLRDAKSLADIIEYYPGSWIESYDSVMIFTTSKDKQQKAFGKSAKLTSDQMEILSTADMSSIIDVYLKYKVKNTVTNELENSEMSLKYQVRPETEATYPDGADGLQKYLRNSTKDEVAQLDSKIGFLALVYFSIDEEGRPVDIEISESSEYKGVDVLLKKVLRDMPIWSPAKNADGNAVKQKFEFAFGFGNEEGGGC